MRFTNTFNTGGNTSNTGGGNIFIPANITSTYTGISFDANYYFSEPTYVKDLNKCTYINYEFLRFEDGNMVFQYGIDKAIFYSPITKENMLHIL